MLPGWIQCSFVLMYMLAVGGQQADRNEGCAKVIANTVSCFNNAGVSLLSRSSNQQNAEILMNEALREINVTKQCRELDKYKSAMQCGLGVIRSCLSSLGLEGAMPDVERVKEGLDVLCRREKDFDNLCYQERLPEIFKCTEGHFGSMMKESQTTNDVSDAICLSTDVFYDCAKLNLEECGGQTKDITLEILNKYQVPTACINKSPGRAGRTSYLVMTSQGTWMGSSILTWMFFTLVALSF